MPHHEKIAERIRQLFETWGTGPHAGDAVAWRVTAIDLESTPASVLVDFAGEGAPLRVAFSAGSTQECFATIGGTAIAHGPIEAQFASDAGMVMRALAAWLGEDHRGRELATLLADRSSATPSASGAASPPPIAARGGRVRLAIDETPGSIRSGASARRLFRDASLEEEFRREGFVILPGLSAEQLEQVRAAVRRIQTDLDSAFYATLWSSDAAYRRAVNDALKAVFDAVIDEILVDYRFCFGGFAVKAASADSALAIHQDWSIVDEPQFQAVNLWCSLVDADAANGCLYLVPRSHRLADLPRPNSAPGEFVSPFDTVLPILQERFGCDVPVAAGRIVALNPAVLHGSGVNRSDRERVAVGVMAVPRESEPRHYFRTSATEIDVYKVDDDFYRHTVTPMNRPHAAVLLETITCPVRQLTDADLRSGEEAPGVVP